MGTVVQFVERLGEDGDWTPAERSQLRDMGSQLAEAAAGLDLVFGKTEEGDPWAVVADQHSEVLLHIARIGGAFVVHAPANDQTVESSDLWQAVTRVVGGVLQRRRGVILPFPPEGMGQQAVLALMVAAAVRGDFHDLMQGPLPGALTANDFTAPTSAPAVAEQAQPLPQQAATAEVRRAPAVVAAAAAVAHATEANGAPHVDGQAPVQGEAPAAQGGPLDGAGHEIQQVATVQPMPWARTAPEPGRLVASGQTPTTMAAGGDRSLPHTDAPPATEGAGFSATGLAQGGTANSAAPAGEARPEQGSGAEAGGGGGGAANHDIAVMAEGPVARGATGAADNFILKLPATVAGGSFAPAGAAGSTIASASGSVSLGVVENFSAVEGDRFLLSNGAAPEVTTVTTLPEAANLVPGAGIGGGAAGVVITGRRFGFDLNGDGREDAFVMVLTTGETQVFHQAASLEITAVAPSGQTESSVTVTTLGIFIGH